MDNEKNKQNLDVEDLDKVSGGHLDKAYGEYQAFVKKRLCAELGHHDVEPTCNCIRRPGESGIGLCISCKKRKGIPLSEHEKMLALVPIRSFCKSSTSGNE